MIEANYIPEILMRGATSGLLLLVCLLFVRKGRGFGVERLGALFLFGTAVYVIISSPAIQPAPGVLLSFMVLTATLNSVFFWWFATALFVDDFKWRLWHFLPLLFLVSLFLVRQFQPDLVAGSQDDIVQQTLIIIMASHAIWLALSHRHDDLLKHRRRFRLVFAALVGLSGISIAIAELILNGERAPLLLTSSHAGILLLMTLAFLSWILRPVPLFVDTAPSRTAVGKEGLPPQDLIELERLQHLIETGIYLQENTTIRVLADAIEIPEHRLRRLINQQLGFRNFSAYLNSYRIKDAIAILEDPMQARRHITQIAFDLGYGSIAPFNRAFKDQLGITPTKFRGLALAKHTAPAADQT